MSDKPPDLPTSLPGGMLVPHLSARRRHEILDIAFEMTGGVQRLAHEMNKSTEGYWEGMKLWGKGLPKIASAELVTSPGIDSLLDRLDAQERARTIEGSFVEVE